jgi:hypothetical protein
MIMTYRQNSGESVGYWAPTYPTNPQ